MASTLTADLKASLNWLNQETLDLSTVNDSAKLDYSKSLANGTAVDLADRIWHDERTITTGANDDLDLTALARTLYGVSSPVALVKLKVLMIVVLSTVTGDKLKLDSSVTNGYVGPFDGSAASKVVVGADSPLILANKKDGFGAVSGTNKIIRITNPGATSVLYRIVLIGTSA